MDAGVCGKLQGLLGFHPRELTSGDAFARLLCRPTDPASLGTLRFLFGLLMILDTFQERGLGRADSVWGNSHECHFPLFNFLQPLPLQWMYIVYLVMLIGAVGIMLGFKFRYSCAMFLGPYWYLFFLQKTSWNNHSYLFGIITFLFILTDANRYWSLDGLLNPQLNNMHVPLWNYTLLRAQIFLVYFLAGLKKCDTDWVNGYPMKYLSEHWVFDIFKFVLSDDQIDLFVVHLGGLFIDLSLGFFLFFDKTRPIGLLMCSSFNLMNSQIFPIGMFPYGMLITQLLFCYANWPRKLFQMIPPSLQLLTPEESEQKMSPNCIYSKEEIKTEEESAPERSLPNLGLPPSQPKAKHKAIACFTVLFISWQCFLPYSHGITKGYNNWTNGLYGYSWDMMVHSWTIQHIRVTYHDKDTGQSGYLDPKVWTSTTRRWSSHADMLKQYSKCIARNLKAYGINNVEIYFDIWQSLNYRFQQRMVNPHVDILTADWSPFSTTSWMLPLMTDLSDWRQKLSDIQTSLNNSGKSQPEVVFVADFPGLFLENFVQPDFGNTSLSVLKGSVTVELLEKGRNVTLNPGESVQVPAGSFHNVHTSLEGPSCYMYLFVNTTEISFMEKYTKFEEDYNKSSSLNETVRKYRNDPNLEQYKRIIADKKKQRKEEGILTQLKEFLRLKYSLFRRSIRLVSGAVYCLLTNHSFDQFLNSTYQWEKKNVRSEIVHGHS